MFQQGKFNMLIDNVHENYDISNFLTEAYQNPGEYFDTMLLRGYFTRLLFLGSDLFNRGDRNFD